MSKTTKIILIVAGIITLVMAILAGTGAFGKNEGIKVSAEKAQLRDITEIVNAPGKVYPEIEVKVSPDISGEITELTVAEGDTVKKGQLLARIYADAYTIQKSQAATGVQQSKAQVSNTEAQSLALKAQLNQAKKTYDMQKKLYDEKVISLNEFNTAASNYESALANYNAAIATIKSSQAGVKSAQDNLAKANTDLSRTVITAPMDGVVSLLNVKEGEKVAGNSFNVGTEILRIADMDKIEVRVDVGENDIPKVKLGDSALITIDAYNDRKFRGIVTQIASSDNSASSLSATSATDVTQYKVYIRILKESYMDLLGKKSFPFRPGMSANADIQTRTQRNVVSVPINAVTTREKPDSVKTKSSNQDDDLDIIVFVKNEDNTVKKVKVNTGIQDINNIEITSGLKAGQEVITGPYDVVSKSLKPGDKVKVVDKSALFEVKKKD
ncbi:MAG TPA: efflux RND transporter periplasmic adaptor subunit [Ferruginibacter sp.]|nr:efflux RND transporter periplasmic adaptor subunit [Niastella sp.]HRB30526.1 efflux RND transporter periplasmic adaptor subunit [Ferruginibacter sp.]